jgi:hypothetical protein
VRIRDPSVEDERSPMVRRPAEAGKIPDRRIPTRPRSRPTSTGRALLRVGGKSDPALVRNAGYQEVGANTEPPARRSDELRGSVLS